MMDLDEGKWTIECFIPKGNMKATLKQRSVLKKKRKWKVQSAQGIWTRSEKEK